MIEVILRLVWMAGIVVATVLSVKWLIRKGIS